MSRYAWLLLIGLSWLAVGLWSARQPLSPALPVSQAGTNQWSLPDEPQDTSREDASAVMETEIWGAAVSIPGMTEAQPLTPPNWRLVGVTLTGQETALLVATEDASKALPPFPGARNSSPRNKPERPTERIDTLKVGDVLPGGAIIKQIAADHVVILLNGRLRRLNIFRE